MDGMDLTPIMKRATVSSVCLSLCVCVCAPKEDKRGKVFCPFHPTPLFRYANPLNDRLQINDMHYFSFYFSRNLYKGQVWGTSRT